MRGQEHSDECTGEVARIHHVQVHVPPHEYSGHVSVAVGLVRVSLIALPAAN